MRIGQLARNAGVSVETVRYYQRIGLLETPEKPFGGARAYRESDAERLRFIRRAQQLGLSLEDIAGLLRVSSRDCLDAQAIAHRKLVLVRQKLADLGRVEKALIEVLDRCRTRAQNDGCPVIAALGGAEGAGQSSFICVLGPYPTSRPDDSRAATGAKDPIPVREIRPGKPGKENR